MNLVASLIVRNELGRYLPECIGHLRTYADKVVVLDDGSTDRTGEWLDDNADDRMVVHHLDDEGGFFSGHEGRKRQQLVNLTLRERPDWVLAIDADEFISDGQLLRDWAEGAARYYSGTLLMEEVWQAANGSLQVRCDGGWRGHPVPIFWHAGLFPPQRWRIADRPLACGREPQIVRSRMSRARGTDVSIYHFGWANQAGRQARYDRYVEADGGKFHQNKHLESIMWPDTKVVLEPRRWPSELLPFRDLIVKVASE